MLAGIQHAGFCRESGDRNDHSVDMVHIYDMRDHIFYEVSLWHGREKLRVDMAGKKTWLDIYAEKVYSLTRNRPTVGRENETYMFRLIW